MNKASNLVIWDFFDGANKNKSSISTSQYFLLCKISKIALMHDFQIDGEIFNPIGILDIDTKCYQDMANFYNIFLNHLRVLGSEKHLLDLILIEPHIKNCLIPKMYPLIIDKLKCLKSVTTLLSVTFLLINTTGLE